MNFLNLESLINTFKGGKKKMFFEDEQVSCGFGTALGGVIDRIKDLGELSLQLFPRH